MKESIVVHESFAAARSRAREIVRAFAPKSLLLLLRLFRTQDGRKIVAFLLARDLPLSLWCRFGLIMRFYKISRTVPCAHLDSEILSFAVEVFRMPASVEGCLVEAGCFKGGSTAKFSIVAKLAGRPLVAFDSFEGIPDNDEDHGRTLYGGSAAFRKGDYCGGLEEVTENVRRYGEIAGCRFIKGYFESTMPGFHESVAATYLDVDLASSTKICLKYLWPLLPPGAIVFSQDGQLPLVLDVLRDTEFWRTELETNPPELIKRESQKLIWFRKPAAVAEAYGLGRQHRVEQAVFREHSLQPDTEPRVTAPPDEEML